MYDFAFDRPSAILRLRLTGFWTDDVMSRFAAEFIPLAERLAKTEPEFAILSDCRNYPVQSAEIGIAWSRLLGPDTSIKVPYAVVVGSTLNKLQAERALTASNVKVFTSLEAASEWLNVRRPDTARRA